ncbi:MAG: BadF/BadG/BcrA/BcrD ATPase family protein [Oscillospiraceae bacterium]|nr:BadF/BadG/BcrA/BcrD ATPase family protein [Oscillospiraceae bacterium]
MEGMRPMTYYAGLDVGGTSARLKLTRRDDAELGEYFGQGCTLNVEGYEEARSRYRTLVLEALKKNNLAPQECAGVCVAASGVDGEETQAQCRRIFEEMGFAKTRLIVCNDCEVLLRCSASADIVLVAGTGSIAVGRKEDGSYLRCGGFGHILSDEGSAYDIAVRTFRLVGDHIDGRAFCPILYRLFTEATGLTQLNELNVYINDHILERPQIARFAHLPEQAAAQGDEAANALLEGRADALFRLLCDTAKKLGKAEEPVKAWLWGSVVAQGSDMEQRLQRRAQASGCVTLMHPPYTALEAAVLTARGLSV